VAIPIIKPICFIDSSTVLRSLRCALLVNRSLPSFASFQGPNFCKSRLSTPPQWCNSESRRKCWRIESGYSTAYGGSWPCPAKSSASPIATLCRSASVANKEWSILHAPVSKSDQIPVSLAHGYALALDSYPAAQLDVWLRIMCCSVAGTSFVYI